MLFFKAIIGHELIKTQGNQIAFTDKKKLNMAEIVFNIYFSFFAFLMMLTSSINTMANRKVLR